MKRKKVEADANSDADASLQLFLTNAEEGATTVDDLEPLKRLDSASLQNLVVAYHATFPKGVFLRQCNVQKGGFTADNGWTSYPVVDTTNPNELRLVQEFSKRSRQERRLHRTTMQAEHEAVRIVFRSTEKDHAGNQLCFHASFPESRVNCENMCVAVTPKEMGDAVEKVRGKWASHDAYEVKLTVTTAVDDTGRSKTLVDTPQDVFVGPRRRAEIFVQFVDLVHRETVRAATHPDSFILNGETAYDGFQIRLAAAYQGTDPETLATMVESIFLPGDPERTEYLIDVFGEEGPYNEHLDLMRTASDEIRGSERVWRVHLKLNFRSYKFAGAIKRNPHITQIALEESAGEVWPLVPLVLRQDPVRFVASCPNILRIIGRDSTVPLDVFRTCVRVAVGIRGRFVCFTSHEWQLSNRDIVAEALRRDNRVFSALAPDLQRSSQMRNIVMPRTVTSTPSVRIPTLHEIFAGVSET